MSGRDTGDREGFVVASCFALVVAALMGIIGCIKVEAFFPFGGTGGKGGTCYYLKMCNRGLRCLETDRKGRPGRQDPGGDAEWWRCFGAGVAFEPCGADNACAAGLSCFADNACVAGLSCVGDRCIPAGGEDEPCRPDGTCVPGLFCLAGTDLHGDGFRRCGAKAKAAAIAARGGLLCILTAAGGGVRCLDMSQPNVVTERVSDFPSEETPYCVASDAGEVQCGATPVRRRDVVPTWVKGLEWEARSLAIWGNRVCVVTRDGAVRCVAKAPPVQRGVPPEPVDVAGLGGRATAVAAGIGHACALMEDGRVMCWGDNSSGQLGDGTTEPRPGPVEAKLPAGGSRAIAAGEDFACAVSAAGAVLCWGTMKEGSGFSVSLRKLGPLPANVPGLDGDATSIWSGGVDLCAVGADGLPRCAGATEAGGFHGLWRYAGVEAMGVATGSGHLCGVTKEGAVACVETWRCRVEKALLNGEGVRLRGEAPVSRENLDCPHAHVIPGTGP